MDENIIEITEKTESVEIKKGLSNVSWLASIIQDLAYLQECMKEETAYEGDNSTLPQDLISIIKDLSVLFIASAKEETDELTNNNETDIIIETQLNDNISLSDKIEDIKKSGSRNSKEDLDKIQKIYELTLELGAVEKSNVTEVESEKSNKIEDLKKFESINEELVKAQKINEDLEKRVKELENLPKPQKAVTMTVSKNEDLEFKDEKEYIVKNASGEYDPIASAIKKSQQNGSILKY